MNGNITILGMVSLSNPHVLVAVTYDDWNHSKTFFNKLPITQYIDLFGTKQDCQNFKAMLQQMVNLIQIEDHQALNEPTKSKLEKILKKTGIKVIYDRGTLSFISITGQNLQAAIDKFQVR
jgi:hypothetical protein